MKKLFYTIWICMYPLIIYTTISLGVCLFIGISLLFYMRWIGESIDIIKIINIISQNGLIITAISAAISVIPLTVFYYLDTEKVRADYIKNTKLSDYIMAVLGGAGIAIILNIIISISGISSLDLEFEKVSQSLSLPPLFVSLICAGIIVPIVEELIFRGLLFNRIRNQYNARSAMIISSLIFGIYHMNWTQGVYATILGLCMAYVYNKVRSLLVPMLIHMSANTVVLIVGEFSANIEYSSLDMPTLTVVAISIFVLPFILAIAGILYFKMRKVNL